MSEWQPIETAPIDGAVVLLVERGCCVYIGRFSWGCWGDQNDDITEPTHWMPIPDPPNDGDL